MQASYHGQAVCIHFHTASQCFQDIQAGKLSRDNSAQQCAYKAAARYLSYVCRYRCVCWLVRFVLPLLVLAVVDVPLPVALAVLLSLFRPQLCLKLAETLHFAISSLHGNALYEMHFDGTRYKAIHDYTGYG